MTENSYDPSKVNAVDPKVFLEVKNYEGTKWKIDKIEVLKETDPYHDEIGNPIEYNPDSKAMCWRAYVTTEALRKYDPAAKTFTNEILVVRDKNGGADIPITVQAAFGMLTNAETGAPEISKHPKGLLWKFIRKLGKTSLAELKGELVMLDSTPSKKEGDNRRFLKIVTA